MFLLPADFVHRIKTQFPDDADLMLASLEEDSRTSIHIHPRKGQQISFDGKSVPWFERGKVLTERPSFTLDPLFHAGCYYSQESSSMFLHYVLEHLFGENRNLTCLDLCAAPGGKSILISSFLKNEGRLISNELIRTRNSILRENLIKWGVDNTIVTCNDPGDFKELTQYFDLVVTDAPCSGEGMFRKDLASRNEWTVGNVQLCSSRQRRILEDITPAIKVGGYLIYSTCTFAPQENEEQMELLISTGMFEEIKIPFQPDWNLLRLRHGLQFLPHKVQGEGFFIAVLRKTSATEENYRSKAKPVFSNLSKTEKQRIDSIADINKRALIRTTREDIYASPFDAEEMNQLVNHLYITMPGVELGEFIKDEFAPAHALALCDFQLHDVPTIDVDETIALQYLRGEALQTQGPKGRALISYRNNPLGWIKLLGNRANNNYPKEWRIRMR